MHRCYIPDKIYNIQNDQDNQSFLHFTLYIIADRCHNNTHRSFHIYDSIKMWRSQSTFAYNIILRQQLDTCNY